MHISLLQPGFSTADADYPELHLRADVLHLSFKDWREQPVRVEFAGVCAVSWQEAEELLPDEPYDGACEVHNSPWAARHAEEANPTDLLRHFRFNFNGSGQLQVLCVSFATLT